MQEQEYSADLGIYSSDVYSETNIETLNKWSSTLYNIEIAILNRYAAYNWKELPRKAFGKYRLVRSFRKIIQHRISTLIDDKRAAVGYQSERSRRKDRTLYAKFMEVAKRELQKDEYKRILEIAKEELMVAEEARNIAEEN